MRLAGQQNAGRVRHAGARVCKPTAYALESGDLAGVQGVVVFFGGDEVAHHKVNGAGVCVGSNDARFIRAGAQPVHAGVDVQGAGALWR